MALVAHFRACDIGPFEHDESFQMGSNRVSAKLKFGKLSGLPRLCPQSDDVVSLARFSY
jgi:hypothetical protein